ncbi:hypothetical protein [Massilia rhizosphaerae]|uniref:hypothetical protein n=1 Tax=Massilia rhizosphaerae TaxID=2784389 RepID=UPI0018DCEAF3|nr:hypothetical protein [Massilia rhizosphaerae]
MDKHAKLRWTVLLSALAATLVAMFYPVDGPVESRIPATVRPGPSPVIKLVAAPASKEQSRPVWIASDENPFGLRVWETSPPPVVESARVVQSAELVQTAPAQEAPPPLPYRFLGQMQDGGNRIIYLGRGEEVLLAHQNDVLEGSYKVVAINDSMIEFESVQSGIRQALPIPAQ